MRNMLEYTTNYNFLYIPNYLKDNIRERYNINESILEIPNTSFSIALKEVKNNSKVFDVGCSFGYVGKYLSKKKNCEVYGVDINREAVQFIQKEKFYKKVLVCDLENKNDREKLIKEDFGNFEYILCLDILEHLKNINEVIIFLLKLLKTKGKIIVSIPNINHINVVTNLIMGNFNYTPLGILDFTHLRFFTKKSFINWIKLITEDNSINVNIDYIGSTKENFKKPENLSEKDFQKITKTLEKLYKNFGAYEDIYSVQHIFSIEKI